MVEKILTHPTILVWLIVAFIIATYKLGVWRDGADAFVKISEFLLKIVLLPFRPFMEKEDEIFEKELASCATTEEREKLIERKNKDFYEKSIVVSILLIFLVFMVIQFAQ